MHRVSPEAIIETEPLMQEELDKYGNPLDGSELRNCCYPDCGCDGARHCMGGSGPNAAAMVLNRDRRSPKPLT